MFEKIKCKIMVSALVLSVVSGLVAGTVVSLVEHREDIAKKCRKTFKRLDDKMF